MVSIRSQETLQKEHDLQAEETVKINLKLQSKPETSDYRDICVDHATFANVLRGFALEETLIVLENRPEIKITGESGEHSVTLFVNGNCWRFYVNGKTSYELDEVEKVGPGRLLKKIWDIVIPNLPENFIIRGVINKETPGFETRSQTLEGLGFGPVQLNSEVYSIKREGKLHPLTLDEFLILTGITPDYLRQSLNVKKIVWPGA